MYRVTGWGGGEIDLVFLETWEDVLMLVDFLQEEQYHSLLAVNCATGKTVLEMSL